MLECPIYNDLRLTYLSPIFNNDLFANLNPLTTLFYASLIKIYNYITNVLLLRAFALNG